MNLTLQFEQPRRRGQYPPWKVAAETPSGFQFLAFLDDLKHCRLLRCVVSVPEDTVMVHAWAGRRPIASVTPTALRQWDIRDRYSQGLYVSPAEYEWLKTTARGSQTAKNYEKTDHPCATKAHK